MGCILVLVFSCVLCLRSGSSIGVNLKRKSVIFSYVFVLYFKFFMMIVAGVVFLRDTNCRFFRLS